MALPDGAFQFDVELLSGMGQIDTSKMRPSSEEPDEEDIMKMFGDENADDMEDDIEAFMDAMD